MATYRETSLGQVTGKLTTQITLPVTYPTLITTIQCRCHGASDGWVALSTYSNVVR